jgi:hypothetical protein
VAFRIGADTRAGDVAVPAAESIPVLPARHLVRAPALPTATVAAASAQARPRVGATLDEFFPVALSRLATVRP